METHGRSTLNSLTFRLVGFGFTKHPLYGMSHFLNVVVYKSMSLARPGYFICISEGPGRGDPESMRLNLGKDTTGTAISPFIARGIEGNVKFADVKKILDDTMPRSIPGLKLEWVDPVKL